MSSRRLSPLAVAGAVLAAGLVHAAPAYAAVKFDPGSRTGFVDKGDVRDAFGWTDATLAARASALVFGQDFWTDDTYTVSCGREAFPVVHHREFGRYELTDTPARNGRSNTPSGYGDSKLTGFRLTGARSGISGTSVAPGVGQPCPQAPGTTIDRVRLVSSTSGWALTVRSGDVQHRLLEGTDISNAGGSGTAAAGLSSPSSDG